MEKIFIKCPKCSHISLHKFFDLVNCYKCGYYGVNFEVLKALSIKQPWAWLIVNGYKNIENRDTLKNFRGTFLIHASKNWDSNYLNLIDKSIEEINIALRSMPMKKSLYEFGGIIGAATIKDCTQKSDSPWFIGKNGFIIDNPVKLAFRECKGQVNFFIPNIL